MTNKEKPGFFNRSESPRYWPQTGPPPPEERLETVCPSCSLVWWVHKNMAGYRLRCECGSWIELPPAVEERDSVSGLLPEAVEEKREETQPAERGIPVDKSGYLKLPDVESGKVYNEDIPTNLAVAPGMLRYANFRTRRKWTNRSIIELAGMLCAFWIPSALLFFLAGEQTRTLYMPFASLAGGILVLLVGLTAGSYTFGLLRKTRLRYFPEALVIAVALAFLAMAWLNFLEQEGLVSEESWLAAVKEELGVPWMLFLIGFCPAIFEELAFRGLLQGRLSALLGEKTGILTTAAAFALAHGITTGFPFHAAAGLYLCLLRNRSGSLFPCMVMHFCYNSTLVFIG